MHSRTGDMDSCEPLCRCLYLNSALLQEKQVLLTTDPFPYPCVSLNRDLGGVVIVVNCKFVLHGQLLYRDFHFGSLVERERDPMERITVRKTAKGK